jgi:hypothetical protein
VELDFWGASGERMKEPTSRRVPEEKAATPDGIRCAIEALSQADSQRLDKFAKNRMRKLGSLTQGMTEGELLNSAVLSLLDGTRRWNPEKVDLTCFLIGAMRSITNNLVRKYDPEKALVLQTDLAKLNPENGDTLTVFETTPDPGRNPEEILLETARRASAARLLRQIEQLLFDDSDALKVLDGWRSELTGPEIMGMFEFTETQFSTIVRRLRRKLEAKGLAFEKERYVQ